MPTVSFECMKHPGRAAVWMCRECDAKFCGPCMSGTAVSGGPRACPYCGGRLREIDPGQRQAQQQQQQAHKLLSMKLGFPLAFGYPFRGRGKWMLLVGTIGLALAKAFESIPAYGVMMWSAKMMLIVSVTGYLMGYLMKIIGETAGGEPEPPDWPELGNFWDDILVPYVRVVVCTIMAYVPLLIVWAVAIWGLDIPFLGLLADPTMITVSWVAIAVGAAYLPMALLAVNLWEDVWACLPHRVLPAMLRVGLPYLLVCGLLLAAILLYHFSSDAIRSLGIVGFVVSWFIYLYILMVVGRIIGLLYACYHKRLNWFEF